MKRLRSMRQCYVVMASILLGLFSLFVFALLMACQDSASKKQTKHEKTITVKVETPTQRLYYNGVLEPLSMRSVLSPVQGRIVQLNFLYGQFVNKDQLLLAIDSTELAQNYRKSIADYLQKKSSYMNSLEAFRGSKALYKAGVISREEFVNSRSQYRTNQLNYYQSRYEMEKILLKVNVNPKTIEHLTLEDAAKVGRLLQRQFKQIAVHSTANGIALFPLRGGDASEDSVKKLELGAFVKAGQLLLTVGNLSGLSTQIHVSEINIDRVHVGMTAIVTVNAFPTLRLKAYVAAVSSQAKIFGDSNGLSEFPIKIKIPKITAKQRKMIRVGMTAKVMLVIHEQPTILLPIRAVFEKEGESMVTIINTLGQRKIVPVVVGFTTPTKVSILHGLRAGDRVVVPDRR